MSDVPPNCRQGDFLAAVAAPQPRLVLPERAAGLDAVVLDAGAAPPLQPRADAVTVGSAWRCRRSPGPLASCGMLCACSSPGEYEVARGAVRLVRAALRDHVQRDARHGDRRIAFRPSRPGSPGTGRSRSTSGDEPSAAMSVIVTPSMLNEFCVAVRAHADVDRLLAALVAGDVQPVHLHAGHLLDDRSTGRAPSGSPSAPRAESSSRSSRAAGSRTGVSPVTVTVAATDEIFSGTVMFVFWPRLTMTPCRSTVVKPWSATLDVVRADRELAESETLRASP